MYQLEKNLLCPYCNAWITILLDPSVANQQYVEDCEICCRPVEISYTVENRELIRFSAHALEQ